MTLARATAMPVLMLAFVLMPHPASGEPREHGEVVYEHDEVTVSPAQP